MLRKIKLFGKLGKIFGKEWNLDVNSISEAVRAIDTNTCGKFSKYLLHGEGSKKYYKIAAKKKENLLFKEEFNIPIYSGDIYIMPALKGSGKYGQVIAGAILIAVSFYAGDWSGSLQRAGLALIVGGISQLLAPNPNAESTDHRDSYLFQGNSMSVVQGNSVGLVYGRALVPPTPISVSTDNIDYKTESENSGVLTQEMINNIIVLR